MRVEAKGNDVDIADRAVGALVFLVPLFDGIRYGKFFFAQFPASRALLSPLSPLINLYYGVPFGTLVVFFGLYFGIVMNYSFSRYVRFNAMQSVLLSVLLVFPRLLEDVFRPALSGPGLQIYISLYNTIWLFVFACVAYGVGSSFLGKVARLPLIADAADQRVM
jgi:uncharacterized membrane protein